MGLDNLTTSDSEDNDGSKRRYIQPTKEEFEECIESAMEDTDWEINRKAPGREYVYESKDFLPEVDHVVLRIFSTIDMRTNKAREKDSDAIRLVVWNKNVDTPMGGRKKTLRIQTYCKNLKQKIKDIFKEYDRYDFECPECSTGWLVEREGEYGKFYGCSNYPDCEHTEQID